MWKCIYMFLLNSTMLSFITFFFIFFFKIRIIYSYIQEHLTPSTFICIFPCFLMINQSCQTIVNMLDNPSITFINTFSCAFNLYFRYFSSEHNRRLNSGWLYLLPYCHQWIIWHDDKSFLMAPIIELLRILKVGWVFWRQKPAVTVIS